MTIPIFAVEVPSGWQGWILGALTFVLGFCANMAMAWIKTNYDFRKQLAGERVEAYKVLLMDLARLNRVWSSINLAFTRFFFLEDKGEGFNEERLKLIDEVMQMLYSDFSPRAEEIDWAKGFIPERFNFLIIEAQDSMSLAARHIGVNQHLFELKQNDQRAVELMATINSAKEGTLKVYREIRKYIHDELYPWEKQK